MTIPIWLALLPLVVLCGCRSVLQLGAAPQRHPNFIIILHDDLGYGDTGPFGNRTHRTPNLNRMAAEGIKLTSFYVASGLCTPSRAALMTGSYPRRVGMHVNSKKYFVLVPGDQSGLNPTEVTLPEMLKARGYATGAIGKWHLGDQAPFLPVRHGFDYYFGIPYSNDMGRHYPDWGFPPLPLMRNEAVIETEPDQNRLTARFTEQAIRFITDHRSHPFFLYLAHAMPHDPAHAGEQFRGKSANGIYGDTVEELDWSTGRMLDTLQALGIDDRTLVIVTSDNGAPRRWGGSNGPLRGFKGSTWEGGMRVPCLARWPGKIRRGSVSDAMATSMDLLPTLAALSGAAVPTDRVLDGRDVWPILSGQPGARTPHDDLLYYFMGDLEAVRSGKWKLHLGHRAPGNTAPVQQDPELYDLEADLGETRDVAVAHPDVVRRLMSIAEGAREELGDDRTGQKGNRTRPPGFFERAAPRTRQVAPGQPLPNPN
jgi:arylsulfatase A-like enzyme